MLVMVVGEELELDGDAVGAEEEELEVLVGWLDGLNGGKTCFLLVCL